MPNSDPRSAEVGWPACTREPRPWRPSGRGTRADRTLTEISVSLPPKIAALDAPLSGPLAARMEQALREVAKLDAEHGPTLDALGALLIRTESVASSKIEQIDASVDDYARASHGVKANPAAVSMVAAAEALQTMVDSIRHGADIELSSILQAHKRLMAKDEALADRAYAGRIRDMQNRIGGSDHSPRNALYVPPPPETVADYLDDLVAYLNRDDIPVLTQACIAHAQFESIHPFTDGNGRIGRVLINTVLRRRGATTHVVVPLASALVAHRDRYFDLLDHYRDGSVAPLQDSFAEATRITASESRATAVRLAELPAEWNEQVGRVRAGSATSMLLEILPSQPVLSAEDACTAVSAAESSVYSAIERLHATGVLKPLTDRKRNQVWGATAILDELDDLGKRIAAAAS
ncbi:Fic family protein [Antrihabitans sp. YC3-6]|uniref:Fic family protein n=1 Tax=Antrihabitans stalagmiti TaxID=2799499 RepID=A0A934U6L9_9NOCA|nr:Fic family protein [Antrihabitans stalagmiti]MBJ8342720.1 Fic family protein [Antrihabitans stalagmiti]